MFVCLVGLLSAVQAIGQVDDLPLGVGVDAAFVAGLLTFSEVLELTGQSRWPWPAVGLIGATALAGGIYAFSLDTLAAWLLFLGTWLLLARLDRDIAVELTSHELGRWVVRAILAFAGGFLPIIVGQIESHFADEEVFVFLQGIGLAGFCFVFLAGQWYLHRGHERRPRGHGTKQAHLVRWAAACSFVGVGIGLAAWGVAAYQHSFYSAHAPGFPGVTETSPFVCGSVAPDPDQPSGADVYQKLLERVEANPYKGAPEWGLLALATGDHDYAQSFREAALAEAQAGHFTEPANSVKSTQYEAALRAYYVARMQSLFPDLFSDNDRKTLRAWFAAINRRALTVEWVDWLYALAFAKWPEGPYENQENGAGLLAILESARLAEPDLSPINRSYLARYQRGWVARFRNTDDAFSYQPVWINNAFFQSLYTSQANPRNVQLSYEWLMLQALPDGAPLRYNHPETFSLAGIAYVGARLLNDARYVWLSDRVVMNLASQGQYQFAEPGLEQKIDLIGRSPTQGSCLLYGNSGLPNQAGPLAPDKIVFRDGWSKDATYAMLNLRFTGWHRYKATGTLTMLYKNGALVAENLASKPFAWLPVGRSHFRDKRVPRENLNGLLISRSGMSAVLYQLTGVGGRWAQDPPHYAQVVGFQAGEELDWAHIRLEGWRGWQYDRWVYFYHGGGPLVIVDEAHGPQSGQAALVWHLTTAQNTEGLRIRLREGEKPAEVLLLPLAGDGAGPRVTPEEADSPGFSVMYSAPRQGQLRVATLFLLGRWAGAEAKLDEQQRAVRISNGQTSITVPLGETQ